MIKIGKPYVKEMPNSTRLYAIVNYDGSDHKIWYGVEKKYAEFLCWERADAFLLAFLPCAKARGIAIPPTAYIRAIPVAIRSIAFRSARSIRPIRKWYHKRMNKKLGCNYKD